MAAGGDTMAGSRVQSRTLYSPGDNPPQLRWSIKCQNVEMKYATIKTGKAPLYDVMTGLWRAEGKVEEWERERGRHVVGGRESRRLLTDRKSKKNTPKKRNE